MQSKKSWFSKTLFEKNIKRMTPLWIVYLLFLLIEVPVSFVLRLNTGARYIDATADKAAEAVDYACQIMHVACNPLFSIIFGFAVALGCFSYLFRARSAYMMHAFPLSRTQIYLTNVLSGLCMLWIPEVLVFLVSIPCFYSVYAGDASGAGMLLMWLLYSAGTSLLFFSIGVFACTLTGNIVAVPFIYGFCLIGIDMIRYITVLFTSMFLYGADSANTSVSVFSPGLMALQNMDFNNYYDSSEAAVQTGWYQVFDGVDESIYSTHGEMLLVGYVIFAIILLIVSMLIYRARQLEETEEVIAFGFLRPVFRWVIGYCFGLGFTVVLVDSLFYDSAARPFAGLILAVLIFGVIAFTVAQMILKKSPRVFKKNFLVETCGFALALLVVFGAVNLDVTGFESKIPDSEDIESVNFNCFGYVDTSDSELISRVVTLHELAVTMKDEIRDELKQAGDDYYYMYITYHLKNGSTLSRRYFAPSTEADLAEESSLISQIKSFENDPLYLEAYIFETDGHPIEIKGGSVENVVLNDEYYDYSDITMDKDQANELYEAVMKDLEAGNLQQFNVDEENGNYANSIILKYTDTTETEKNENYAYINFGPESANTIATLEKLGILTENDLVTEKELETIYQ